MEALALSARRGSGLKKAAPAKKKKQSALEAYVHKWLPNPLHRSIAKHGALFVCSVLGFAFLGESLNPAQLTVD
jgi:hypothetical protein